MKRNSKIVCIVQARMSSSRLPGKSFKDICGKPVIQRVIERVSKSKLLSDVWLACSEHNTDNILEKFANNHSINIYRGSLDDVLSRYVNISKRVKADTIVRITGDCPLIDSSLIDKIINIHKNLSSDYTSNTLIRSFPDGLDVEVFSSECLYQADLNSNNAFMREHVTPYIHGRLANKFPSGKFKREQLINNIDYSQYRWTLDEKSDLFFLRKIYKSLNDYCSWMEVIDFLKKNPELIEINKHIQFNEGSLIGLKKLENGKD